MLNFPYEFKKIDGKKYLGITSWLSQFEEPFIPEEVAKKVSENRNSEYYGIPIEQILKIWNDSSTRGNKKHKEIEDWLKISGEKTNDCKIIENSLGINPENSYAEIKLFSNELLLSGKPDIVQRIEKNNIIYFYVHDLKTFRKMDYSKIEKTSKQIMIYCKMIRENIPDKNVSIRPGKIIVIRPKNALTDMVSFDFYEPEFYNFDKNILPDLSNMILKRKSEI